MGKKKREKRARREAAERAARVAAEAAGEARAGRERRRQGGGKRGAAGAASPRPGAVVERVDRFEVFAPGTLRLEAVDLGARVDHDDYEDRIVALQQRAYELQIRGWLDGRRTIFAFEGWDAAGKGGCIKRLTALMDPRGLKVWPIAAPRDEEARQHYLWRFWERLPEKGEVAVFDRSWYGRVLVERVEGFAKEKAWRRAYDEINAFERMLTADGVRIAKFWLHIDRKTQLERFEARETDPVKNYKLSAEDWRNRKKWQEYAVAVEDMFDRTHRPDAPWTIIPANDKKTARLRVLETCVQLLTP